MAWMLLPAFFGMNVNRLPANFQGLLP